MSRRRITVVTFAIALGLFLAALEATVVGTAMPTIISQLGGLASYSWVFSIYMLASTTTVPVFGRLSDIYGRKPIYMVGVALFLAGSIASGLSQSMTQLIIFRGLQGLGAGALMPVAFTIVGDIFTIEQRTKVQSVFSAVWGVSSVLGPLVGGWIVDNSSWRWVFYLNLPFGIISALLIWFALREERIERQKRQIDYAGAILMTGGSIFLLFGMLEGANIGWMSPFTSGAILLGVAMLAAFLWVEQRAAEPILPLSLFRDRLFTAAVSQGLMAGLAVFGTISFLPLFMQGVLGSSATEAGQALTPMLMAWVLTSMVAGPVLLRLGYRPLVRTGGVLMVLGTFLLTQLNAQMPVAAVLVSTGVLGAGMGLTVVPYLISVQSSVSKANLGIATSTLQFARQMGGAFGASLMGAMLTATIASSGVQADPQMLLGEGTASIPAATLTALRASLAAGLHNTFLLAMGAAVVALLIAFWSPDRTLNLKARPSEGVMAAD